MAYITKFTGGFLGLIEGLFHVKGLELFHRRCYWHGVRSALCCF